MKRTVVLELKYKPNIKIDECIIRWMTKFLISKENYGFEMTKSVTIRTFMNVDEQMYKNIVLRISRNKFSQQVKINTVKIGGGPGLSTPYKHNDVLPIIETRDYSNKEWQDHIDLIEEGFDQTSPLKRFNVGKRGKKALQKRNKVEQIQRRRKAESIFLELLEQAYDNTIPRSIATIALPILNEQLKSRNVEEKMVLA